MNRVPLLYSELVAMRYTLIPRTDDDRDASRYRYQAFDGSIVTVNGCLPIRAVRP